MTSPSIKISNNMPLNPTIGDIWVNNNGAVMIHTGNGNNQSLGNVVEAPLTWLPYPEYSVTLKINGESVNMLESKLNQIVSDHLELQKLCEEIPEIQAEYERLQILVKLYRE